MYVGNLSFEVNENELKELMGEFGNVASAKIITDRESGRSKGFGFVEMDDNTEASKAINALNGKMLKGRAMVVNESVKRN
jgi:RNA recognition motif-containing protein